MQKGFTLVELVVVLAVIGILSVMVTAQWSGASITLNAQATQLENDIRFTQSLSMTQAVRYCLVLSSTSYQIVNSATGTAVSLPDGDSTVALGNNISFGTMVPSGMRLLVFDGRGIPYFSTNATCNTASAAAATALSSNANIPLVSSGTIQTVVISPETGRALTQ